MFFSIRISLGPHTVFSPPSDGDCGRDESIATSIVLPVVPSLLELRIESININELNLMSRFTSGERRGLIVLTVLLGALPLWLCIKSFFFGNAEVKDDGIAVRFDTIAAAPDTVVADSADKRVRSPKKAAKHNEKKPKPTVYRNPLDDVVN